MGLLTSITTAFLYITYQALELYKMAIIVSAIMSWLVSFNVINTHNRFVQMVGDFLYRITEPALRPIRRFVPPLGGFDLSPLALFFVIIFIQVIIQNQMMHMAR